MTMLAHTLISVARKAARACRAPRLKSVEAPAPLAQQRLPRALMCMRMIGGVLWDRSAARWLFPLIVGAPPCAAQDLCVLA
jgi:hypothetical protein